MDPAKPMAAIDCHAHVFSAEAPAVPGARYRPPYAATLDAWRAQWDRAGVTHGVIVQISFFGTNNDEMVAALARAPDRLRGVAVVDPRVPDAGLDRLHAAGVRGIRWNLQGATDFSPYATAVWSSLLRRVADRGWHLEALAPRGRAPELAAILAKSPIDTVFDHFANPGEGDATFDALKSLARDRAVYVKLSGPYRLAGHDPRALARRWMDVLGPERLVWGSDWPWTQHEAGRDYAALREELDGWIGAERAPAVLWDNAARLYRFD